MLTTGYLLGFVLKQTALVTALREKYPLSNDEALLLDFPTSGSLHCMGVEWVFQKHGLGFRFTCHSTGEFIDIHSEFQNPEVFDAWRLAIHLESTGHYREESDVMSDLRELAKSGALEALEFQTFRLSRRPLQ